MDSENTVNVETDSEKEPVSRNFIEQIIEKDLQEGQYDHVQTRFPPEPNGYPQRKNLQGRGCLHLSIMMNWHA